LRRSHLKRDRSGSASLVVQKQAKQTLPTQIERVVRRLYGKPCWGVKPGFGSFLTLEFGKPNLEVREPVVASKAASERVRQALARRRVQVHGEWHLWIYCCHWEVLSGNKRVGDSSSKTKIRRAAEFLNGQKLIGFAVSPGNVNCVFDFDLGASLKTRPYDKDGEQWLLYGPSHKVLTLRADGFYTYQGSGLHEDRGRWKPMRRSQER
jgi:hypothetical protein